MSKLNFLFTHPNSFRLRGIDIDQYGILIRGGGRVPPHDGLSYL